MELCKQKIMVFKSTFLTITLLTQVKIELFFTVAMVFKIRFNHYSRCLFRLMRRHRRLTKAWTAIDRLSIIWKSDLTDKMKCSFFQAAVVSILLYGCTTWALTKRLEKKLDGNYTRMLRLICRDEIISDVLLWTPAYGRAKAGRPAGTYIQQLSEDTGCSLDDPPETLNDREKWRERVRDICASGTTWWWWWLL